MPDREKVIRGLECCVRYYDDENRRACVKCPYREPYPFTCMSLYPMLKDALEALKGQEARVLTWDELMGLPSGIETDVPVVVETKTPVGKWDGGSMCQWKPAGFVQEMVRDHTWYNREQYGKIWRAWNARPTVKEREDTKWEE